MRVLLLDRQPSVRAHRLAAGLRSALEDVEVRLATQGDVAYEVFDRGWRLGLQPERMLPAVLADYRPDLVHSVSPPDSLTAVAAEVLEGRVPVVHDVQALETPTGASGANGSSSVRSLERRAVEGSAGLVAASAELLGELQARYRPTIPALVFPNYPLRSDLPRLLAFTEHRIADPPRLVYHGPLGMSGGPDDLRAVFEELVGEGVTLDVYPEVDVPEYRALAFAGLTVHSPRATGEILRELPRYDFGWTGFGRARDTTHADTALPANVFEYLACGLPVLSLDHRAIAHLLRERGLGIALPTIQELARELARRDLSKLRRRVGAARYTLTVEANAGQLAGLYEQLVELAPVPA
jgi:glycosyltransferase involved in cell wall biosynthesis